MHVPPHDLPCIKNKMRRQRGLNCPLLRPFDSWTSSDHRSPAPSLLGPMAPWGSGKYSEDDAKMHATFGGVTYLIGVITCFLGCVYGFCYHHLNEYIPSNFQLGFVCFLLLLSLLSFCHYHIIFFLQQSLLYDD